MKVLNTVDFKAVAAKGRFVYVYLRKGDKTPYYVGLGKRAVRPFQKHNVVVPDEKWRVRVLRQGLTLEEAIRWEQFYILHYGRLDNGTGILRNLTDGGEGTEGLIVSEETKAKMSKASKGKAKSEEHKAAIKKGRQSLSPEARANYSRANSRPCSEGAKERIAATLRANHLRKLQELGLTEEEWAERKKQEKAARRVELRLERQAKHGKYQQSPQARANYQAAALRREQAKRAQREELSAVA